jgi:hypothetical protein
MMSRASFQAIPWSKPIFLNGIVISDPKLPKNDVSEIFPS